MRASTLVFGILVTGALAAATGCELGSRQPPREQVRPYDLAPQSGYLTDGSTVAADYAVPVPGDEAGSDAQFDEAAYRAAIQKDLLRINALLTENERLRQELAVAQAALEDARDEIEQLDEAVTALEAKLERAEERAARRARRTGGNE
jgi:hypothetical protein